MSGYSRYLAFAETLADTAGEITRRYFRSAFATESKEDASPVTQADREAEAAMRRRIKAEFPSHGIVGEEYGNLRVDAEFVWVLDPIDGTLSFITGRPLFTTLIALLHQAVPVLGIIDQPVLRERWAGIKGDASCLNGQPVRTSAIDTIADAHFSTTSPYLFSASERAIFEYFPAHCRSSVFGNDAYAYALLAGGMLDLVVEAGLKPYDYMALIPVIEGAGGIITDWRGKPLTLGSGGRVVAAANKAVHSEALKILETVDG